MLFWTHWRRLINLGPILSKRVPAPQPAPRRRPRRLSLEALEDRTLLSAALALDQPAYAPGQTAVITGTGFNPNDALNLQITRTDANSSRTTYSPLTVTDDANGNFTATWALPTNETTDPATAAYQITANDLTTSANGLATAAFARLAPSVQTDKLDYSPGQTATITGSGFQAGETVDMQVINTATNTTAGLPPTWTVTADTHGNIQTSWTCTSDLAGATLELDATGESSGLAASETFTDSRDNNMSLVSSAYIGPNTVAKGSTLVPIITFTVQNISTQTDTLQSVKVHFTGSQPGSINTDLSKIYLYSESGSVPGTFSPNDTQLASVAAPNLGSDTLLTPKTALTINAGAQVQFYIVVDVQSSAVTNHTIDFEVASDAIKFGGGTDFGSKINPTGSTTISSAVVAPTTTTVASPSNPSTYGQSVTFTATVTSTSTPTGSVYFVIDGDNAHHFTGTAGTTTGTTATWTYSTSTLAVSGSPHTVQAFYTHTGNFTDSNGTLNGGQTVNADSTSTSVSSSANPSDFGQSVTFTATVSNTSAHGVGSPTGSVEFYDGSTDLGAGTAGASGSNSATWTFRTSTLSAASHTIKAVYSNSDGNYTGSNGSLSQTVNSAGK